MESSASAIIEINVFDYEVSIIQFDSKNGRKPRGMSLANKQILVKREVIAKETQPNNEVIAKNIRATPNAICDLSSRNFMSKSPTIIAIFRRNTCCEQNKKIT